MVCPGDTPHCDTGRETGASGRHSQRKGNPYSRYGNTGYFLSLVLKGVCCQMLSFRAQLQQCAGSENTEIAT